MKKVPLQEPIKNGRPGKFELANHGTLFLDEIGDMPLHMQVKLLRVLQNRTIERIGGTSSVDIDVRIIAATNKNLEAMIQRNEFREDLYFRLNVIPLHIPPLRERQEDIMPLLTRALQKFNNILGKQIQGFENEALSLLLTHRWPGNVRELENAVEYAVNMENSPLIRAENLPNRMRNVNEQRILSNEQAIYSDKHSTIPVSCELQFDNLSNMGRTLKEQTDAAQRQIIQDCLMTTGFHRDGKKAAAKILGISESSLYRKMRELGIKTNIF